MGGRDFRFQQFTVEHDRCGHRVGTDGVLLGAWARVEGCHRILDIGTGSGLIALMAAQRNPQAEVVGVEIDAEAAAQATENVSRSPFAEKVSIHCVDVREFRTERRFDAVVCNPPFFVEDTLPEKVSRARARHSAMLRFETLLGEVKRLLDDDGEFSVIIPCASVNHFVNQAFIAGLSLVRTCLIRTVAYKSPKRAMLAFSPSARLSNAVEQLVLQDASGGRTAEYAELTKDFYL